MKNSKTIKVRKRGKSSYELRYSHKNISYSICAKSIAECRKLYKEQMFERKATRTIKTSTFKVWFDKWIDLYRKDSLKTNTLKNLLGLFNNYVMPDLASKPLKQVKTEHIQNIINKMKDIPRQATICFVQLNACFKQAFKLNMISFNPCSAVVIKKNKGNNGKALTKNQEQTLIDYLNNTNNELKDLILLYLATGMRRTELLNVRYCDLNFETNEILINGTKTKNSIRVLQTTKKVLDLFPKKEIPFDNWKPDRVDNHFKIICDFLKFKGIKIHSLRHTFATRCIENGIQMAVVQQWLGHSSISLTIDTYTHLNEDFKREQANKVDFSFF